MSETVLERIVNLLERAGRQTTPDQSAPAAVLWPDPEPGMAPLAQALAHLVVLARTTRD